jgi:hypothetical protein
VALKRAIGKLYFGVEEVSHFEEDLKRKARNFGKVIQLKPPILAITHNRNPLGVTMESSGGFNLNRLS